MCLVEHPNRILSCQVGDLHPGTRYRDPQGNTLMVTDAPLPDGETAVVNLQTGEVASVPSATNLGHDRKDRLYASRWLNPPTTDPESAKLTAPKPCKYCGSNHNRLESEFCSSTCEDTYNDEPA